MSTKIKKYELTVVVCLFLIAFLAEPFVQLAQLSIMPGNIGDARLNNYFLENIYQFFKGGAPSLIHLSFFYPFPYVLGFSDNLFGSSPVYLIARALTGQPDTAFQIWYLVGYFVNYIAAYYALRKLEASTIASAVGALIFAFALPITAHSGHAQLHYRFGLPLSIAMFILFLDKRDWRYFVASAGWLVWQFYCTIYIGFFLLLVLSAMSCIYAASLFMARGGNAKLKIKEFIEQWFAISKNTRFKLIFAIVVLAILMGLLFYPYLQVSSLYGAKRSLDEIASMLPRPQSYFLSDESWLWSSQSKVFAGIPMRHEHHMFVGAIPMLLAFIGFLVGSKRDNGSAFSLLSGSLAALMLLTLFWGGFSLWYLIAPLPLASAIRAVTRIDVVFLFPVAFLSAVAIDKLRCQANWGNKVLFAGIIPLLMFEFSATSPSVSPKAEWRDRLVAKENSIPANLPQNSVLFFAQSKGPWYADELDAMWVSLKRGLPTMNGYSGNFPPSFKIAYGDDCAELPRRIQSYLQFSGTQDDPMAYRRLAQRVVPIGLSGCDPAWLTNPPPFSWSNRAYTPDEFKALSIQYVGRQKQLGQWYVDLKIVNAGNQTISASSAIGKPVRVSWRFIDAGGRPLTGWDTRKDLPFDVPVHGSLDIRIPIDSKSSEQGKSLEVSLVQEGVFWGHDVGVVPMSIDWKTE